MRKVSAVRVEEHDELARGFAQALRQVPDLLPEMLPKQVVIKPNLCDIYRVGNGRDHRPAVVGRAGAGTARCAAGCADSSGRIRWDQRVQELPVVR